MPECVFCGSSGEWVSHSSDHKGVCSSCLRKLKQLLERA